MRTLNLFRKQLKTVASIFAIVTVSTVSPALAQTIDTNTKYQEIEGFGASIAFYNGWVTAHRNVKEIYDIVFTDLQPTIFRMANWNQDLGHPNSTAKKESDRIAGLKTDATIVAEGRKRIGNRFKILMCSWRIPEYLRVGDRGDGINTLKKDDNGKYMYAEYGQWWKNSLIDYEKYNILPDWISIQNEPDFNYDSNQSSLLSWKEGNNGNAGYGPALKAVYDSISTLPRRQNGQLKIIGPEVLGIGWGNFDNYMNNLDTALLDGYAYHIYGQGNYDKPDEIRTHVQNAAKWKNKPFFMTEFGWNNDKPEDNMIGLTSLIINHLVYGNLSAYIDWTLVWPEPEGEMVQIEFPWGAYTKFPRGYNILPEYHAMRHFTRYVNPGMRRVKVSSLPDLVRGVAFATTNNDTVVAVLVNISTTEKPLNIKGLDGYDLSEICLSVKDGLKSASNKPSAIIKAATIPAEIPEQLPGKSIATIVWVRQPNSINDILSESPAIAVRGKTLNVSSPDNAEMQIRVVDLSGKTVDSFNTKGDANLSLEKIPAGTYIIETQRVKDGLKITSKVVLTR